MNKEMEKLYQRQGTTPRHVSIHLTTFQYMTRIFGMTPGEARETLNNNPLVYEEPADE